MDRAPPFSPSPDRYAHRGATWLRRCGRSGLVLPAVSLGCWYNFGDDADPAAVRAMVLTAFDAGVFHFDLACNYGPPAGGAERSVGRVLAGDLARHRDELVIATKAGCPFGPGPYGSGASRKNLLQSIDGSLRRLNLDHVDVFYSHKPDPAVPLEETLFALDSIVRQGKALYVGISSYSGEATARAAALCKANGWVRPIVHQPGYSMLNRGIESDLLPATTAAGMGVVAYGPLAQGVLSGKYLAGVPADSRGGRAGNWRGSKLSEDVQSKVARLATVAAARGQSLSQLALQWTLRPQAGGQVTSAIVGASSPEQVTENVKAADAPPLSEDELRQIDVILGRA